MVRLKAATKRQHEKGDGNFNSTMVRLKERGIVVLMMLPVNFNSTMVRLKVSVLAIFRSYLVHFNSTMVRLKGLISSFRRVSSNAFQFHYGSVKSSCKG